MRRFRLAAAGACALVLLTAGGSALALPKFEVPSAADDLSRADCEFAQVQLGIPMAPFVIGYPIAGFTVKISAESVKFVGGLPYCGIPNFVAPLPSFEWSAFRPDGSPVELADATTLAPLLYLDAVGSYTVKLTVCPGPVGCSIQPPGGHADPIQVVNQIIDVPIQALESAPLGPETFPQVPESRNPCEPDPSNPEPLPPDKCDPAPADQCSFGAGLIGRQWWAVRELHGPDDYRLLEGFVRGSRVSRKDSGTNHSSQDTNYHMEPDPKYDYLLLEDGLNPDAEHDLEVEWERASIPERFRPTVGDRASIFGYWVTDCSHNRHEIHPPVGLAVHRPRPIRVPDTRTFSELGEQIAGTGLYVPGIITDIFFSTRGGTLVGCGAIDGLANAERIQDPNGVMRPDCVPAPSLQRVFEFDIYLPRNPQVTMAEAGITAPPAPLYVDDAAVYNSPGPHPQPAIERRTSPSGVTYLHVTLDLRGYPHSEYKHQIVSGWVLPSSTNWDLARWRLRLNRLSVSDDGDGDISGSGDWRLWVNTNNASNDAPASVLCDQEWVQVIDHDVTGPIVLSPNSAPVPGTVDFGGRPWETGPNPAGGCLALHDRWLGPDLLRYPRPASGYQPIPGPRDYGILFHSTGYEADPVTDDDAGTVLDSDVRPGDPPMWNECKTDLDFGGLVYSGCVHYSADFEAFPGPALAAPALSRAGQGLANQYVLRCPPSNTGTGGIGVCDTPGAPRGLLAAAIEPLEIEARDAHLEPGSAPVELSEFPPFEPGEREEGALTDISVADFYRVITQTQKADPDLAAKYLAAIRATLDPAKSEEGEPSETIWQAQILKAALPAELWTQYFGDLPAPQPDPSASTAKLVGLARLSGSTEPVNLLALPLHCSAQRQPNWLAVVWRRSGPGRASGALNRFELDFVVGANCTDAPGAMGMAHTLHGTGIGRLNGVPGAQIEWTLVDGGLRGVDSASIKIRSDDLRGFALDVSGEVGFGNLLILPPLQSVKKE